MRTAPYDLGVDSGGDGLSVTGPAPRLSWKDPVERDIRSAYLVEAEIDGAEPILAEASGRRLVRWPFGALGSRQRVRWRVRAAGPDAHWSEWTAFESGLLDADWSASWISPIEPAPGSD